MNNEHFNGKYEVELKFRLKSKARFMEYLQRITYEIMLEENTESDWYFDTENNALSAQNKSLCIRTMEPSGIKLWIVKGPEHDRCEATNITDAAKAESMLETLGYHKVLQVKKIRSIYFIDKYHLTVDTLVGIGHFAEFAIMTDDKSKLSLYRKELEELSAKFGLSTSDVEDCSYKKICERHYING
ncbi:class IV adenylate cyclase [Shewanella dokdonensis]|uniref:Class IV adenylate cyclase n=1 Tax=Shewanella dokdonensis TaxID=712036 RepID=A0ABX8DCM5_9GAMM|nr:class IV adenylate cyclase [Shewanella dokdonensis]MCL1074571.1 class IV adenylate cyclase [Shewanella dokdonensis]QVK22411.1 class IV adenylate cyclase [Shewanella dokdonensis]